MLLNKSWNRWKIEDEYNDDGAQILILVFLSLHTFPRWVFPGSRCISTLFLAQIPLLSSRCKMHNCPLGGHLCIWALWEPKSGRSSWSHLLSIPSLSSSPLFLSWWMASCSICFPSRNLLVSPLIFVIAVSNFANCHLLKNPPIRKQIKRPRETPKGVDLYYSHLGDEIVVHMIGFLNKWSWLHFNFMLPFTSHFPPLISSHCDQSVWFCHQNQVTLDSVAPLLKGF